MLVELVIDELDIKCGIYLDRTSMRLPAQLQQSILPHGGTECRTGAQSPPDHLQCIVYIFRHAQVVCQCSCTWGEGNMERGHWMQTHSSASLTDITLVLAMARVCAYVFCVPANLLVGCECCPSCLT